MTRIFVQRGSSTSRASAAASQASTQLPSSSSREEESHEAGIGFDEVVESLVSGEDKCNELVQETDREDAILDKNLLVDVVKSDDGCGESTETQIVVKELGEPRIGGENLQLNIGEGNSREKSLSSPVLLGGSSPPPPPVPPPKLSSNTSLNSRRGGSRGGLSRRSVGIGWPPVGNRTSPVSSRPSSPHGHVDSEGYNSADEQIPSYGPYGPSYNDAERERQFELDIRRIKGLELRRMLEDGNCLFRAVAQQVYGDPELHELTRQMCIDYMERERDHFSQFVTEGFISYCNRKRRDKVYGNNLEIQALCEMYNRPIHIYSYSTEPINIFQGGYNTDSPPVRLSYHQGNHYNSLVDPRRLSIGAGLGFSNLQGTNVDKDKVKAVIKAQEDQQIDNAILAEGKFYSDLELTEKEIERMVIETSRAEYLAKEKYGARESSTSSGARESSTSSGAEPSSSGARPSSAGSDSGPERKMNQDMLSSSMQVALSMGFSYIQAVEAYSIFSEDVDSMICYLLETGGDSPSPPNSKSRRKGKATER